MLYDFPLCSTIFFYLIFRATNSDFNTSYAFCHLLNCSVAKSLIDAESIVLQLTLSALIFIPWAILILGVLLFSLFLLSDFSSSVDWNSVLVAGVPQVTAELHEGATVSPPVVEQIVFSALHSLLQ